MAGWAERIRTALCRIRTCLSKASPPIGSSARVNRICAGLAITSAAAVAPEATFTLGLTRIGPLSVRPETSNKMIQKELAFQRERSGTVTVPGANSPSGILPRRPFGHCGALAVAAPIAVATEWRIP